MGGFVLLYSRDGAPIPDHWSERSLLALTAPYGERQFERFSWGALAWASTTELALDPQPPQLFHNIEAKKTTFLDGRCRLRRPTPSIMEDANTRLSAKSMEQALNPSQNVTTANFLGSFCALQIDGRRGQVKLLRDYLGDQTLFYFLDEHYFLAASEMGPLLAIPEIDRSLDSQRLSAFFAAAPPPAGHTFFSVIRELPAGSILTVGREQVQWRPRPPLSAVETAHLSHQTIVARFAATLKDAVADSLDRAQPNGLALSGGLDSGSIAAIAVRQLGLCDLRAFSYIFDHFQSCDERPYLRCITGELDLSARQIPCDDAYPLANWDAWPHNPETPEDNPYRQLKERVYTAAREAACPVLLTGAYGDTLYVGGNYWLIEDLRQGAWSHLWRESRWHIRRFGWRTFLQSAACKRLLGRGRHRITKPIWLTESAWSQLVDSPPEPRPGRADQANVILGTYGAHGCAAERFHANRHGLVLRHPYRYVPLIELALGLPANLLYARGTFKVVLREALAGVLPERIRHRTEETPLTPLLQKGFQARARIQALLHDAPKTWQDYVDPAWAMGLLERPFQHQREALAFWNLICFLRWHA